MRINNMSCLLWIEHVLNAMLMCYYLSILRMYLRKGDLFKMFEML